MAEAVSRHGILLEPRRIEVARFRSDLKDRRVRVARNWQGEIAGRRVLIVADIVSTGLTLSALMTWLQRRGALGIDVCALLDRQNARLVEIPVRYLGFVAPNDFVVGFGLELFQQFRGLPHIAALASSGSGITSEVASAPHDGHLPIP